MADRSGLFVLPLPGNPPAGTSPTDGRLVLGALFGTGPGCISGGRLEQLSSSMAINIYPAVWRIPDPSNASAVFLSPIDFTAVSFSAGPASGARIDVIWVRQYNYEASEAHSRVVYGVTAGVASGSPTEPAIPAGAMKVGRLYVPAGASNSAACTLTPFFAGQAVLVPSIAVDSEANLPTGTYTGQQAVVTTVGITGGQVTITERWDGSVWKRWDSPWLSFLPNGSPTGIGNFGGGQSQVNFRWRYVAGEVEVRGQVLLGDGGGCGNGVFFDLPTPASTLAGTFDILGQAEFLKAGSGFSIGGAIGFNSTTQVFVRYASVPNGGGGALAAADLSATAPIAWASGDVLFVRLRYTPA